MNRNREFGVQFSLQVQAYPEGMTAVSEQQIVSRGAGQQHDPSRDLHIDHREAVGRPNEALVTRL